VRAAAAEAEDEEEEEGRRETGTEGADEGSSAKLLRFSIAIAIARSFAVQTGRSQKMKNN
jgi:hypothetical protein